ncbi:MAG: ABC transporter substrate-binding protein [Methylococcales bacterium]|nr:ABC transporter substrate-binding protein [Methylococcales bacterium]
MMKKSLTLAFALISLPLLAAPKEKSKQPPSPAIQTIDIAYLSQTQNPPTEMLSNLDPFVADKGSEGAELAISDNNTTGEFTKQKFVLHKFIVPADGNVSEAFKTNIAGKFSYVITNLNAEKTLAVSDLSKNADTLFFDAGTFDDALRNQQCRANTLHILPSRAMKADALAQYMMKKKWTKWFLVVGNAPEDTLFADALKRSAKHFGMKIVTEKKWEHTFDDRKTAQSDISVFTQSSDYDVLVVADEQGLFGEYLAYRTWLARPIIGTQGLIATSWHSTHDLWGATQIQHRFYDLARRNMEEQDYGAYLAVRALGEAATRTKSNELKTVREYLKSSALALQGYKGNALSFRAWDGQLRQPILLAAPRSLVSVAPVEGFLHPKTELDTLGFDEKESGCKL